MSAHSFSLFTQSRRQAGEPVELIVVPRSEDGQVLHSYQGAVELTSTDAEADLPARYTFTGREHGRAALAATLNTGGVQRLLARDSATGAQGMSSGITVAATLPEQFLLWGDLHGGGSLGVPSAAGLDRLFVQARDYLCLDFCALAAPDFVPCSGREIDVLWEDCQAAVRHFHRPNKFITLLGYEWTDASSAAGEPPRAHGHRGVLYLREEESPFSSRRPDSDTPHKLWQCLAGRDAIVIPLHPSAPSSGSTDWQWHEPEFERLAEVYSGWGSSERPASAGNPFPVATVTPDAEVAGSHLQHALAAGSRFGVVGAGGAHDPWCGRAPQPADQVAPTSPGPHSYRGGLTGLYARELTRGAVWEALSAGRTYATTGARIVVEFFLNDQPMGSEVELLYDDLVRLSARVLGTADLASVEVLKNNRTLYRYAGAGPDLRFNAADETDVESGDYYYLRVTQKDGHMAWTSPIWVE